MCKVTIDVTPDGSEKLFEILHSLTLKIDLMATKQERFDAILTRIDSVTTNIADDYRAFLEEYREGTVSEESLAKAEANITKLEELAASKENPIPGETTPPADEETNEGGTGTNTGTNTGEGVNQANNPTLG